MNHPSTFNQTVVYQRHGRSHLAACFGWRRDQQRNAADQQWPNKLDKYVRRHSVDTLFEPAKKPTLKSGCRQQQYSGDPGPAVGPTRSEKRLGEKATRAVPLRFVEHTSNELAAGRKPSQARR